MKNPRKMTNKDFARETAESIRELKNAKKGQPKALPPTSYPNGMVGVVITGDISKIMDIFAQLGEIEDINYGQLVRVDPRGDVAAIFDILRQLKDAGVEFADGWRV